jgi:hypothetical protein
MTDQVVGEYTTCNTRRNRVEDYAAEESPNLHQRSGWLVMTMDDEVLIVLIFHLISCLFNS